MLSSFSTFETKDESRASQNLVRTVSNISWSGCDSSRLRVCSA